MVAAAAVRPAAHCQVVRRKQKNVYPHVAVIEELARSKDVELRRHGQSTEVVLHRDDIVVTITVPDAVLEWYVDVFDSDGCKIHDWCDYTGYDRAPVNQLAQSMADDLARFLERISSRQLRVCRASSGPTLEWRNADAWSQAVPLVSDAPSA